MELTTSADPRVIKTNRAIYRAFIDLVNEKGFTAMTVQELLDEALINRKTFYKYFQDKYDLAERVGEAFLREFDDIVRQRLATGESALPMAQAEAVYQELYRRRDEIRAIWSIRTDRLDVLAEMRRRLQGVYLRLASATEAEGDTEFQAAMFSSLVINSYEHILERDAPFESHKLLREYRRLFDVIERAARG